MKRIYLLLALFISLAPVSLLAQTQGQVFKPASGTRSNGQLVLDPNGDGFVSKASCGLQGFSASGCGDDLLNSEIPFRALRTPITEPLSDLSTGGGGGHTDIVAGIDDSGSMIWSDGTYLYFRIRIKSASTASKGYTFLFNTTGTFGTINSGNPGFQYEVVLQTGGGSAGINVYNYTSVPNNSTASFVYNLNTHFQKAVSGIDIITSQPAYFYTFYVPWSDLASIGFTNSMPFRAVAATITSSNSGINGTVSDVNGINDSSFGSIADAFAAVINAFPPTSGSTLTNSNFPAVLASVPTISSNINTTSTTISGYSTEPNLTGIQLFKDTAENGTFGTSIPTTSFSYNSSTGLWTVGVSASNMIFQDYIRAKATATSKGTSGFSNAKRVSNLVSCNLATPTMSARVNGVQNITVTWTHTSTILANSARVRLYNQTGPNTFVLLNGATEYYISGGSTTGTVSYVTGLTQTQFNNANIVGTVEYQGCTTDYSAVSLGNGQSVTATPVTNANVATINYTAANISVQNTAGSAATLYLYVNNALIATQADVAANATHNFPNPGLSVTNTIYARASLTTGAWLSAPSNVVTAVGNITTSAPTITGSYVAGGTTVSGTSTELPGTNIYVFEGSNQIGTATVNAFGTWTATVTTLQTGWVLTAKAQAPEELLSASSNSVTVLAAAILTPQITTTTITPSLTSVTINVSNTQGVTTVYADGNVLGTVSGGVLTVTGATQLAFIREGVAIYAYNVVSGATSAISNIVTVSKAAPSQISLVASPSSPFAGDITTVYATVTDAFGAPANAGVNVTFTIQSGNGSLIGTTTVATNSFGLATIQYQTFGTVETAVIKGAVGTSYDNTVSITSQTPPSRPNVVTLTPTANATNVALDGTVSVLFDQDIASSSLGSITIRDAQNNIVSGVSGSLSGSGNRLLTIAHANFVNDKTYTVSVPAFSVLNAASQGNAAVTWSFSTPSTAVPHTLTLTGPSSVTAGSTSSNFTVTVVDNANNPVNVAANTTFEITTEESGTATVTSTPVTVTAGSSSATFTYSNTKVGDGTHTITATRTGGDALPGGTSDTHDITVNPAAASQYLVTSSTSSPVAGATVTITAQLADQYGNPVSTSGQTVT
jgi:hypothetical protein